MSRIRTKTPWLVAVGAAALLGLSACGGQAATQTSAPAD